MEHGGIVFRHERLDTIAQSVVTMDTNIDNKHHTFVCLM
jgi:hypothetical protein